MKIDNDDYKILCRDQQSLLTIQDYIERLAKDGINSVSLDVLSVMAGVSDEVAELRKEASNE